MADLRKMSDQFEGLPMEGLIGGPLEAAAKAQISLARSTSDYINSVGFHSDGSIRSVDFKYEATDQKSDGTVYLKEITVTVPMLAVVPIPNLQIDKVDITFNMEVRESVVEASESDASQKRGRETDEATDEIEDGERVKIYGQTSSHQENTRSSDNSAKYHVEVHASNHGMPEGLQRVLDMMASSVAPRRIVGYDLDGEGKRIGEGRPITNPADVE
jgi:hypothetical protein